LLSLVQLTLAHTGEDDYAHHSGMMGGMMTGMYGYSGMFFGWTFSILVLVALVLLIVWLIKQIQKK
jgi:predicted lipid-binding transport protein (Tim44 family)